MKLDAITVTEVVGDDINSVETYSNDDEGTKEAHKDFIAKAMDKGATADEAVQFAADAYYESGNYQLFLTVPSE